VDVGFDDARGELTFTVEGRVPATASS
jgi:hypothetical protein